MKLATSPKPLTMAASLVCSAVCSLAWAQSPAPAAPVNATIPTDASVWGDMQAYKVQQAAIQAINDRGTLPPQGGQRVASYSLSKAQCWLDVSFHEYTRNDRSSFPRLAFDESTRITRFLASGGVPGTEQDPASATAMISDAARLRPDLWLRLQGLQSHAGAACAQQLRACAEVELVHASHEFNQLGWRHAKPYLQIAEDTVVRAETTAQQCLPKPVVQVPEPIPVPVQAPVPAPVATPTPPPQVATPERLVLSASALFAFDRRAQNDILPNGRSDLSELARRLDRVYASIQRIDVIGHTDRLGKPAYNALLSLDRAQTVAAYLKSQGVSAPINASGQGASRPVTSCPDAKPSASLTACLQPDRRVEIDIYGFRR